MKVDGTREGWDTPCIGICSTTNIGDKVCRGCGRTNVEVINWNTYRKDQKVKINRRIRDARRRV